MWFNLQAEAGRLSQFRANILEPRAVELHSQEEEDEEGGGEEEVGEEGEEGEEEEEVQAGVHTALICPVAHVSAVLPLPPPSLTLFSLQHYN